MGRGCYAYRVSWLLRFSFICEAAGLPFFFIGSGCSTNAWSRGVPGRVLEDLFLFTVVGAVVTRDATSFAAIGDGVAFLNGARLPLGAFEDNAPPYLAYALSNLETPPPRFERLASVDTREVASILLATDGAEGLLDATLAVGLPDLWRQDRIFRNPDGLRRWLSLADRRGAGLSDDTTVVVLRRKSGGLR